MIEIYSSMALSLVANGLQSLTVFHAVQLVGVCVCVNSTTDYVRALKNKLCQRPKLVSMSIRSDEIWNMWRVHTNVLISRSRSGAGRAVTCQQYNSTGTTHSTSTTRQCICLSQQSPWYTALHTAVCNSAFHPLWDGKMSELSNNKLALYGTDGRLLLNANFKVTWHNN